ncbi:MAG: CHAT domain-containing protein [Saprospiraceae bacterium]
MSIGYKDKSIQLLKELETYTTKINLKDRDFFAHDLFLSENHLLAGSYEKAYEVMSRRYEQIKDIPNTVMVALSQKVVSNTLLADILLRMGRNQEAMTHIQMAEALMGYNQDAVFLLAYVKYIAGKVRLSLGQYQEAKNTLEGMKQKLLSYGATDTKGAVEIYIAELMEVKAQAYHESYRKSKDIGELKQAHAIIGESMDYLFRFWGQLINQHNLKYSLIEYYKIFETALSINHDLYHQTGDEQYFWNVLQIQSLMGNVLLRSSLKKEEIAQQAGVPMRLLDKESTLYQEIWRLSYQANQMTGESREGALNMLDSIKSVWIETSREIAAIHPTFAREQHFQRAVSQEAIRAYAQKHQVTILTYSVGKDQLFLTAVAPNDVHFTVTPIGRDSLHQLVQDFRESLSRNPGNPSPESLATLATSGYKLYDLLLKPVEGMATSRLIIIPDGALEVLPFAALLRKPTDSGKMPFSVWPFAIKSFSFSYAYSMDILLESVQSLSKHKKQEILAFAPKFTATTPQGTKEDFLRYNGNLKNNIEEVAHIARHFKGAFYLGDKAKITTFKEKAPHYSILHLASHAKADTAIGNFSWLALSPQLGEDARLEVWELYDMTIPADLVVLSACETGLGEWQMGEGVVGLERAFAYAGAKSLVTTHWQVSDKASAQIMEIFYEELSQGKSKDEALRNAQLAFLNQGIDWLAHPFFWAAFVQKGNAEPLLIDKRWLPILDWYIIVGLALLPVVGWWWHRKSRAA